MRIYASGSSTEISFFPFRPEVDHTYYAHSTA